MSCPSSSCETCGGACAWGDEADGLCELCRKETATHCAGDPDDPSGVCAGCLELIRQEYRA